MNEPYCNYNDAGFLYKDTKVVDKSELYLIEKGTVELNRDLIFDADDDIIILPDIRTKKVNQALILRSSEMPVLFKALDVFETIPFDTIIFKNIGTIIEEGTTLEESMIN